MHVLTVVVFSFPQEILNITDIRCNSAEVFQERFSLWQVEMRCAYVPAETPASSHKHGRTTQIQRTGALHSHRVAYCGFTIQERVPGAQGDADQAHPHAAAGVRYIPMTVLLRGEVQSDGTSASSQKEKQKVSKCKLRLQWPLSSNQPIRVMHPCTVINSK